MTKIVYKLKSGIYKSKVLEDWEIPKAKEKLRNSKEVEYYWAEKIYERQGC